MRDANCVCEYESLISAIKSLLLRRIIFDFEEKSEVGINSRKLKVITFC